MQFLLGAAVLGVGILIGASIVQATINRVNSEKDDNGIR